MREGKARFCRPACRAASHYRQRNPGAVTVQEGNEGKLCSGCGADISLKRAVNARWCSDACRIREDRKQRTISHVCENCGDRFINKERLTRFCTLRCSMLARYPDRIVSKHDGYVYVRPDAKTPRMAEHRLVMMRMVNGPLPSGHDVHHLNGDKTDNRPENLVIMTRSEHMSLHESDRANRWSRHHDACVTCGRTSVKHRGNGRCGPCYDAEWRSRRLVAS